MPSNLLWKIGRPVFGVGFAAAATFHAAEITAGNPIHLWDNNFYRAVVGLTALGFLFLVIGAAVGIVQWRRHTKTPQPMKTPQSATVRRTHIGELNAEIDSTADTVTDESDIEKWKGDVKHRPGPRRRTGCVRPCVRNRAWKSTHICGLPDTLLDMGYEPGEEERWTIASTARRGSRRSRGGRSSWRRRARTPPTQRSVGAGASPRISCA